MCCFSAADVSLVFFCVRHSAVRSFVPAWEYSDDTVFRDSSSCRFVAFRSIDARAENHATGVAKYGEGIIWEWYA